MFDLAETILQCCAIHSRRCPPNSVKAAERGNSRPDFSSEILVFCLKLNNVLKEKFCSLLADAFAGEHEEFASRRGVPKIIPYLDTGIIW